MNTIQTSLLALLAVMILTLSMNLIADQTDKKELASTGLFQGYTDVAAAQAPEKAVGSDLIAVSSVRRTAVNDVKASDEDTASVSAVIAADEDSSLPSDSVQHEPNREKVWSDISEAITSLNDMVGDDMFRQLTRKDSTTMEVRVDADYWQRVRYETRVDLKNDISNIWHLYVRQYNEDNQSAVFFIDDESGKTIDIFTQRRRTEQ